MEYLYKIIGDILYAIYQVVHDYGFAIIILTVLVKLFLLPIAVKQQKAMIDMQKIQPQLEEIRRKYKNDLNKMNEETMKLYAEHRVNPLGGCLPPLIQLPIFISLYTVIYHPLKYILKFTDNQLYGINYALNSLIKPDTIKSEIQMIEVSKEIVSGIGPNNLIQGLVDKMQGLPDLQLLMAKLSTYQINTLSEVAELIKSASSISMDFLNIMNLAQTPSLYHITPIIIIPFLAAFTTYLSSRIAMKTSTSTSTSEDNSMQHSMMMVFTFMTLFITFSLPAGLGLYWTVSNILQMIQQYFLNKYVSKGRLQQVNENG